MDAAFSDTMAEHNVDLFEEYFHGIITPCEIHTRHVPRAVSTNCLARKYLVVGRCFSARKEAFTSFLPIPIQFQIIDARRYSKLFFFIFEFYTLCRT